MTLHNQLICKKCSYVGERETFPINNNETVCPKCNSTEIQYELGVPDFLQAKEDQQKMQSFLLECKDTNIQSLAQGEFKGHWYFGKQFSFQGRPVDSVVFDNGEVLINEKQTIKNKKEREFYKNYIELVGMYYSSPLLDLNNSWSLKSINNYIRNEYIQCRHVGESPLQGMSENRPSIPTTPTLHTLPTNTTLTTLPTQLPIYDRIEGIQLKYMDLYKSELITIINCYILATYCIELFNSIGIILMVSAPGSGKTKWAMIMQLLSFNGFNATDATPSALFRMAEQTRGLMCIDDYEKVEEDKKNAIDQILKVGYKKGGKTCRSEKVGDNYEPRFFDVYGPKVVTNTVGLDSILYTRCIPIHLLKTITDKGKLNPIETDPIWQTLRDDCYIWVMNNWQTVKNNYENIDVKELNNRDLELVKPLLAIAKTISDEEYKKLEKIVIEIFKDRDMFDFANDWDYILFNALYKDIGSKERWVSATYCSNLMLRDEHFNDSEKKKPGTPWVGKTLTPIDLYKKRRVATGVEYLLSKESLEKYMGSRGWLVRSDEPTHTDPTLKEAVKNE